MWVLINIGLVLLGMLLGTLLLSFINYYSMHNIPTPKVKPPKEEKHNEV